jgi:hypothetical protein
MISLEFIENINKTKNMQKSTKNITNEFGFEFKESSTLMKNILC